MKQINKALILAAGQGTRLRPITNDRPKPMVPINGVPLLQHIVTWLRAHGVTDLAMNLHYKPDVIVDWFGDGSRFDVTITYSHEPELLGTAGAAKKLEPFFAGEPFLVVYGDVLTDMDLSPLVTLHQARVARHRTEARGTLALTTLTLYRVPNPQECGIVELDNNGRLLRLVEKPPVDEVFSDLASAGLFVAEPGILDYVPADTFCDFGFHVFPMLLERGVPMYGYPIPDDTYLIDIGSLDKYARAQAEWPARASATT